MKKKKLRVDSKVRTSEKGHYAFFGKLTERVILNRLRKIDCLVLRRKVASLFFWDYTGNLKSGSIKNMMKLRKLMSEFDEGEMCTCFTDKQVTKALRILGYGAEIATRRGEAKSAGSDAVYSLGSIEIHRGYCPANRNKKICHHCIGIPKEPIKELLNES